MGGYHSFLFCIIFGVPSVYLYDDLFYTTQIGRDLPEMLLIFVVYHQFIGTSHPKVLTGNVITTLALYNLSICALQQFILCL